MKVKSLNREFGAHGCPAKMDEKSNLSNRVTPALLKDLILNFVKWKSNLSIGLVLRGLKDLIFSSIFEYLCTMAIDGDTVYL